MSTESLIKFFIGVGLIFLGSYAIYREKDLIRLERKLKRKVKVYVRAFVWATEAYMAERTGKDMFVILKTPGREPERRHNVANNFKAIARELDSDNTDVLDIGMNIKMFYDSEAFSKQAAPCITDGRAEKIYYGDVVFVALDSEDNPRGLTEREVKYVENYINMYRADKLAS